MKRRNLTSHSNPSFSAATPHANETARIEAFKRFWDGFGLSIFSIQLGSEGAFHTDAEVRKACMTTTRDPTELVPQLECSCVGLWLYGALGKQTVTEAIEPLGHSLAETAKLAETQGIVSLFESEPAIAFKQEEHMIDGWEVPDPYDACIKGVKTSKQGE